MISGVHKKILKTQGMVVVNEINKKYAILT